MTFSNVKVGDKVWSFNKGWGFVEAINETHQYPLDVRFPDTEFESYSLCGKLLDNYINPDLFWDEVVFEVPEKPLPNLEVDTKLIVWNKDSPSVKYKRYFSHFSEDGRINVFCMGATSFSADCASANTCVWSEYEVVVASNL